MKKILQVVGALLLSGCATVVSGTSQTVAISSTPQGAYCSVSRGGGQVGAISSTPGNVSVGKSGSALSVTCSKPGYQSATSFANSSFNGWTFGNIVVGGLIGVAVDASTGANFDYPASIDVPMQPDVSARPMISQRLEQMEPTPASMAARSMVTAKGMAQPDGSRGKRAFLRGACSAGDMSACILAEADAPTRTRRD